MDIKIEGTSLVLSIKVTIYADGIIVSDPLEWLALLVEPKKRICNSFDDNAIPLYEWFFTRIGLLLPFHGFEVAVLKNLKVSPSQFIRGLKCFKGISTLYRS